MDEKPNQAEETLVPAADQAPNQGTAQAPTASAEQGVDGAPVDETLPTDDVQAPTEATAPTTPGSDEQANEQEGRSGLGVAAVIGAALGAVALGAAVLGRVRQEADDDDADRPDANADADAGVEAETSAGEAAEAVNGDLESDAYQADAEAVSRSALEQDVPQASDETGDDSAAVDAFLRGQSAEATESDVAWEAPALSAPEVATSEMAAPEAMPEMMPEMTMEDVLAASDEQLARAPVHRGMIATGSIIMLAQDGIVVDVGAKIEGLLPYNQLFEFDANAEEAAKYFKAGDEIQVYVVRADIPNNTIVLSKKRADQERAWNLLQDIFDRQLPVEVEIVEKVRGGLVANLGVRAFLPASQIDIRRVNDLSPYVGKRLKVRIIELNRKRNRVIVSRRSILEEEVEELKADTLKRLEPGLQLEGEIVEITDFGAFVNLGGVDGLVHRSELTHGRFNHPREAVELGQKVRVEVLDMDLERERINLSMKKLIPNPWENVLFNYAIGQRVTGKVTNLTPFGAFVEIEPGLEGLIHVSEMSWTKRVRHPKEVLTEGDTVEAMILKIDSEQQRISLGLRQTQPDPWSSLPDRYPPGTEVTGPITGITDFGVFMEIEEGIEGLVHISELAHEHIENIEDHFQKGEEVTAVILNIDPVEQRASLSRKRLLPFTAGEGGAEMPLGAPASNRSGARKGRRGGRRSAGIDYDYSYAATDPASKATTKLGDVYADLFAQFGLTESKKDDEAKPARAEKPAEPEQRSSEARPERQPEAEVRAEDDEPVDPENAIDAAEAAALLTAAFREGRRPQRQDSPDTSATADDAGNDLGDDSAEDSSAQDADSQASDEETDEEAEKTEA